MMMIMMTVISVSSEAAVEELRRLLLLLLGSAVQVITRSYDRHALVKADHSSFCACYLKTKREDRHNRFHFTLHVLSSKISSK